MNNEWLTTIVCLALDDLAEGHVDLPTILHLVADLAWREGYWKCSRVVDGVASVDPPGTQLLVSQGFDGLQLCGSPGGVAPGDDAD